MKKLILATLCVVMVAGAAQATDFNWVSTNTTSTGTMGDFTNGLSWDNGTSYPQTAADRAFIQNGAYMVDVQAGLTTPVTYTMGQMVVGNGAYFYMWSRAYTWNISAAGGNSGDWWYRSTANGAMYSSGPSTWNIDGNVLNANGSNWVGTYCPSTTINMYGTGKAIRILRSGSNWGGNVIYINIYGNGIWDNNSSWGAQNVEVTRFKTGVVIGDCGTAIAGNWNSRIFIFEDGQHNLPTLGKNVNFDFGPLQADNGPLTKRMLAVPGLIYPQDVCVGAQYWGSAQVNPNYVWRPQGGDLTVGRDFKLQSPAGGSPGNFYFDTEDNNTPGTFRNVTVYHNMLVGGSSANEVYLFKLNSSTLRIGGSLTVGSSNTSNSGAMDLGSGTVYLGGSLTFYQPSTWSAANWNAGTSTLICNGNGTAYHQTQTLTPWGECGVTLNNVVINNFGGTVQLFNGVGGALRLSGNFEVDNGTFTGNKRPIMFNGPSHTITNYVNPSTYQFDDNLTLLTGTTVLCLGSDITLKPGDNLTMASGSVIYLCGHVLKDEGKTYDGTLTGTVWTNTEGTGSTIYALSNVPEPATLATFATAALAVFARLRRRRLS